MDRALSEFGNSRKIGAILRIAEEIAKHGFVTVKARIETEGIAYIRTLPFMGPATAYHLAKNLGLDVIKPDRHLLRVAAAGYESPDTLCEVISKLVGDRVCVVDLVIWRFATLNGDYVQHFSRVGA